MNRLYSIQTNLSSPVDTPVSKQYIGRVANKEKLRDRLEEVMKERNVSLRAFAALVGVSHGTLSNMRNLIGVAEPETLQKLAPFFKEDFDRLLIWAGHKQDSATDTPRPDIWLRAAPDATPEEIAEALPVVETMVRALIEQQRKARRSP